MIVAVAGGKGGAGKTTLAVALCAELRNKYRVLLVDADVDNPTIKVYLRGKPSRVEVIWDFKPEILNDRCKLCGACVEACPEGALALIPGKGLMLLEHLCSGCRVCMLKCPHSAILAGRRELGRIEEYKGEYAAIVGELKAGMRKSVPLAYLVVKRAMEVAENYDFVIIDTHPGTGSGVYASIEKADLVLAVTEPTSLGVSDLKKHLKLLKKLGKRYAVVANKWGAGGAEDALEELARGAPLFKIPYHRCVEEANAKAVPLQKTCEDRPRRAIAEIAKFLASYV